MVTSQLLFSRYFSCAAGLKLMRMCLHDLSICFLVDAMWKIRLYQFSDDTANLATVADPRFRSAAANKDLPFVFAELVEYFSFRTRCLSCISSCLPSRNIILYGWSESAYRLFNNIKQGEMQNTAQ
jgi:hypothetical protein